MNILIIEDEVKVVNFLMKGLKREHYIVDAAYDGEQGMTNALVNNYDIILLDYLLPKKNGLEIVRELRLQKCTSKILMLTARDAVDDRVSCLDAGADDYLVKPFAFEELLARIRVLLRRNESQLSNVLTFHDLSINLTTHEVKRADKILQLTPKEYILLEYFMRHPNKMLSRTELSEHVWDANFDTDSNVIDVYIYYLRAKIDKDFSDKLLHTHRGKGYQLKATNEL